MIIIKLGLKVQVHTQNGGKRTRIYTALDTFLNLWVKTIVLGDGENILCSSIDTSADVHVEEFLERVTHRDVVEFEV